MSGLLSAWRAARTPYAEKGRAVSRRNLLVTIWVFTFLLLAGVGAFSYVQLENIETRQRAGVDSTLSNLTRVNEEHALRTFRAADQTLRFMMTHYADEGARLDLAALVSRGVIDGSLFAQLGIIDEKGIFQLSNVPFSKGLDLSDREHFKVHIAADADGDLFVSKPVLGRASGKSSIQLTRRINRPDGSFGGVAVVSVNAAYFARFYSELDLPPQSVAALVGLDGVIRARQQDDLQSFGGHIPGAQLFQLIENGAARGSYTSRSVVDQVERVYAYRKIPGYPLAVTIGIATDTLRATAAPARQALLMQAAALGLLLLMTASASTFYSLRLQRELAKRHDIATELRLSEERLALALIGGALGAWDWNLTEEQFTCNAQLPALIGYQADELSYAPGLFVSLIHPDETGAFFTSLRRHLKGETRSFKNEFRLRHKQGGWVWISLMSQVMERDSGGRAVRLSGTAHDVTSRVKATQALTESEERWNLAITGSNEGIWDWNVAAGTLYASARLITMLGHETSASSATLQSWVSYIHPEDVVRARRQMLLHFRGDSDFYRIELRLRNKDGSYQWMLIRGRALQDTTGRAVRVTGSASDITEQRQARQQLEERKEQLNAIFSLSPDAFVSFDRDLRVKYVNPAFQQLTGLASSSVLGLSEEKFAETMNALCLPASPFRGLGALRESSPLTARTERELIELAIPSRRVLQAKLKTSESASVSQILFLHDVTHEIIVEDMKTEFLSTAAHELRTPMAGILGFAEVLLTHELDEAQRHEFTNIILTQSQQMASILDELLDLARIEARRGKDFVFESVDLHLLVQEVVAGFSLPKGRLAPVIDMLPMVCRVDRGKARQSILNVLSNAYKYSTAGEVSITLAESLATCGRPLAGILIRDEGIGMKTEHLQRVFERFYRADTSGRTQGTGLGMSIVREIMDLHEGEVAIESTAGKGTTVTLLFPVVLVPALPDALA